MRSVVNISILVTLAFISCSGPGSGAKSDASEAEAETFKWVEGKFIFVDDQSGYYYEEWHKTDENNYNGNGYYLTRDCVDTIFTMKMHLLHEKDRTIMFYDVKNQNNNKETEFTLTKGENNFYVFENPFRDFPSIMQYKIYGDSAINIVERGFANNKEKLVEYTLKRID